MKKIASLLLSLLTMISCSKDNPADIVHPMVTLDTIESSHVESYIGYYSGVANYDYTHPAGDTAYEMSVFADVQKSDSDSCLNFIVTYDDTIVHEFKNLHFSPDMVHFSHVGSGGSGGGVLNIHFEADTLHYNHRQRCGIPCRYIIDFIINKISN